MLQFLLIILSSLSFADEAKITYEIGNSIIFFARNENMIINKSCKSDCLAYKKGKIADSFKVDSKDLVGGKNPASVRCSKYLGGVVVIGKSEEGHQQSFCYFKDESYLKN